MHNISRSFTRGKSLCVNEKIYIPLQKCEALLGSKNSKQKAYCQWKTTRKDTSQHKNCILSDQALELYLWILHC